MIKNIVVYKNQRKIIYAIHKYNRRIFNDIYTYGYANRRISYDEIRSWWVCLFDPLCWTCRKMISNKIYNELVPYLYFCGPGGDEIVNVSQKQVDELVFDMPVGTMEAFIIRSEQKDLAECMSMLDKREQDLCNELETISRIKSYIRKEIEPYN